VDPCSVVLADQQPDWTDGSMCDVCPAKVMGSVNKLYHYKFSNKTKKAGPFLVWS
jgi:hypothetical protein